MDYLGILQDHLGFIGRFYKAAAEPFETTLRKIEEGEEPFEPPRYAPEDYVGPEYYLHAAMEAQKCLGVLGNCCLGLLEKALHDYLREFIKREADVLSNEDLASVLRKYRRSKDSWFTCYCNFLIDRTKFEWARSSVTFERIEQINLSRNDLNHHDQMICVTQPRQSEQHFEKYPVSRFAREWEIDAFSGEEDKPQSPLTIDITREKLSAAIADVQQFCAFVEDHRTKWHNR